MSDNGKVSKEKVVLVTGGAEGIGRAIVSSFVANGNRVIMVDKNDKLGRKVQEQNENVLFMAADLSDPTASKGVIKTVDEELGRLDILVNNAGFQHVSSIENFPDDVFMSMINLMVVTPFLLSKYSLPLMKKNGWGRIVNIASIHGLVASPLKAGYVTSKHGLVGLTKAIAVESAPFGITCNAIAPTYVNTRLVSNQIKSQAENLHIEEERVINEVLMRNSPVRRLLEPNEVASLVMYLCLNDASAINGSILTMDHGYTSL